MAGIDPKTFVNQRGRDCATAGLRNLMHHFGCPISESMVFGLGGGWWFWYCQIPGASFPVLLGQNVTVEQDFCHWLDIPCEWRAPANAGDLGTSLDRVRSGQPTLMKADPYYLDYCWEGVPLEHRHHFGEHIVLAVTVTGETIWVSDIWSDELQQVPLNRFQAARTTSEGAAYLRPNGRWLDIRMPAELIDWRARIGDAVRDMAQRMQSSRGDFGLAGLRSVGPRLRSWLEQQTDSAMASQAMLLIALRLDGGAGASGFRVFLADFLEEAADLLESRPLAKASEWVRRDLVPLWAEAIGVLRTLSERPHDGTSRERLVKIFADIAAKEEAVCRFLSSI